MAVDSREIAMILAATTVLAMTRHARANGAFPDSQAIYAPSAHPHQLVLGTNFGLLVSEDDGRSWYWVCEQTIGPLPYFFPVGNAETLYAATTDPGVRLTRDHCNWSTVQIDTPARVVIDLFVDPSDEAHVLAIGRIPTSSTAAPIADQLYASESGGDSFTLLYASDPVERLDSIEVAKSSRQRVYATMSTRPPVKRYVLRSDDGGSHFSKIDQTSALDSRLPLIIAVDPDNADRIYFRLLRRGPTEGDAFAISEDGGATIRTTFMASNRLTAFLRVDADTLILGADVVGGGTGAQSGGYISTDRGVTFSPWANSPRIRALVSRDGAIFAAADNFVDGFAAGVTRDLGKTWQALIAYDQIKGPLLNCEPVKTACDSPGPSGQPSAWADLVGMFQIHPDGGVDAGGSHSGCRCGELGARARSSADVRRGWIWISLAIGLGIVRRLRTGSCRGSADRRAGRRRAGGCR
jgi:hypothetical protein